jgi:hypothetical protein
MLSPGFFFFKSDFAYCLESILGLEIVTKLADTRKRPSPHLYNLCLIAWYTCCSKRRWKRQGTRCRIVVGWRMLRRTCWWKATNDRVRRICDSLAGTVVQFGRAHCSFYVFRDVDAGTEPPFPFLIDVSPLATWCCTDNRYESLTRPSSCFANTNSCSVFRNHRKYSM